MDTAFPKGPSLFVRPSRYRLAGLTGIAEKLIPKVKATRTRSRQTLPSEIVDIFEDEMAELFNSL